MFKRNSKQKKTLIQSKKNETRTQIKYWKSRTQHFLPRCLVKWVLVVVMEWWRQKINERRRKEKKTEMLSQHQKTTEKLFYEKRRSIFLVFRCSFFPSFRFCEEALSNRVKCFSMPFAIYIWQKTRDSRQNSNKYSIWHSRAHYTHNITN